MYENRFSTYAQPMGTEAKKNTFFFCLIFVKLIWTDNDTTA